VDRVELCCSMLAKTLFGVSPVLHKFFQRRSSPKKTSRMLRVFNLVLVVDLHGGVMTMLGKLLSIVG